MVNEGRVVMLLRQKGGGQWVRRFRALALLASAVIHQTGGVELADATQTREGLERGVG